MNKYRGKWSRGEGHQNNAATTKAAVIKDIENEDIDQNGSKLKDKGIGFEGIMKRTKISTKKRQRMKREDEKLIVLWWYREIRDCGS